MSRIYKRIYKMSENTLEKDKVNLLLEAVRTKFGKTLDSGSDYDSLSLDIQRSTGEQISGTTIKRLYKYIKRPTVPRTSTLSILARYVGYAGWSDFCEKSGEIPAAEPAAEDRNNEEYHEEDDIRNNASSDSNSFSRKTGIYFSVAAVAVIAAAIATAIIFFLKSPENKNSDRGSAVKDTLVIVSDADTVLITLRDSLQIKYDAILDECHNFAQEQCSEIMGHYGSMDIIDYYQFVNAEYLKTVFTDIKNLVDRRTSEAFSDTTIRDRYNAEIFAACRDYCAQKLLRDFPSDELRKAYEEKEKKGKENEGLQ